jgi:hypothetical protein
MDIIDDIIKESKEKKVSSGAGEKKKDEAKIPSIFGDGAIDNQNQEFTSAIDKILIAHRNTKFFLFCMSW